jgi:hypothetical protein
MLESIFGNFHRIFGIFRIFYVAFRNYLAISRLFLSRKYSLEIKKKEEETFSLFHFFLPFRLVATFSPTDEVCCRPLNSLSQFSFSRPQPGPLRPNYSDPRPAAQRSNRGPAWPAPPPSTTDADRWAPLVIPDLAPCRRWTLGVPVAHTCAASQAWAARQQVRPAMF